MADRSVRVVLSAIVAPFQASFAKATASAKAMEVQLGRTSAAGKGTQGALMGMGRGSMMAMGGAGLAAYGLVKGLSSAANAAIDFESSFAGVRKTVDATEAEFEILEQGMLDLAKEIPVSVNELNRIGELGGQLGVAKDSLIGFTEVVAKMGVTTNLTVEDAATRFAQFANITQMPQDQFENLGSAVVELGNNSAATEAEIVEFGQRIAGAGEIAGFTEGDILGIGTAVASLGVNAEAGGTAIQKVMLTITESVELGDEKLATFAETAGMSADRFARKWRSDPAQAFIAFTEGLGKAGTSSIGILKQLGLTDQRLIRSFLSLASAGDLLATSTETGNSAFRDANALQEEAAKRFETTESKILLAKNQIEDLKIAAGEGLAVALGDAAQAFTDVMQVSSRVNESLASTVTLLTQLAHGMDEGTVTSDRFIQTVMSNIPLLENRLAGAPETIGELRRALQLMVQDIESDTLFERLGQWGGSEADEGMRDQAKAVLELVKTMDDGTPIAKEYAEVLGVTGDETKAAGKKMAAGGRAAAAAEEDFSLLFETREDFFDWREGIPSSLGDISGAFSDLGDDATVTAAELIEAFQKQSNAVADFKHNINVLISRGAKPQLIKDLIDMGDQGAVWAQALADSGEKSTRAFMRARSGANRELNGLTSLVNKAERNISSDFDKIGGDIKRNSDKAADAVDALTTALKGLPAQTSVSVDYQVETTGSGKVPLGSPTAAGVSGVPTAWALQAMNAVPGSQAISSGYRPTDTDSFHSMPPPFNAVDIVGANLPSVFAWLVDKYGNQAREVLFQHTLVERGRASYYAPADHFDHVHLADMGAIVRGPAMIAQGNITEAHIPLTGPGAKGFSISGVLEIPGLGRTMLRNAHLTMNERDHRQARIDSARLAG